MSRIKRSTYQKLAEENKRLKADIKILTVSRFEPLSPEYISTVTKWRLHFEKEEKFNIMMKEACGIYLDKNPQFKILKDGSYQETQKA